MRKVFGLVVSTLAPLTLLLLPACSLTGATPAELADKARAHIEGGDLRGAYIELSNALQEAPDFLEGRYLLAQVAVGLGDGAKAEKEVRRAMELGLAPESGQPLLVKAIFMQGDFGRVLAESNTLPPGVSNADRAQMLGLRGQIFAERRELDQAEAALEKALAIQADSPTALVGMALLHSVKRDYEAARDWARRATEADGSSADAWSMLGQIELQEGNAAEAEAALTKAVSGREYATLDLAKRAMARSQLGKFSEAQSDIEKLKSQGLGDDSYVNYVAGVNFFRQEKYGEAAEALEASGQRSGPYLPREYYLASSYLQLGRLEQARRSAELVNSMAPQWAAGKRLLGAVQINQADLDAATEVLREALGDAPNDTAMLQMLGYVAMLTGDAARAVQYYERAVVLEPDAERAKEMLTVARFMDGQSLETNTASDVGSAAVGGDVFQQEFLQALVAFRDGKLRQALKQAEVLSVRFPDNVEPIKLMAACYLAAGRWDDAKAHLRSVLELEPSEPSATRNLAQVEMQLGNLESGRALLLGLTEQWPTDEEAFLLLARIEARLHGEDAAAQVLERAITQNPDALRARAGLAAEHLRKGNVAKVLELTGGLRQEQWSAQPSLLGVRGKAQLLGGDTASARDSFRRWAEAAPESAEAHFHYGDSLARTGDVERARQALAQALAINPDYVAARVAEVKTLVHAGDVEGAKASLATLEQRFGDRPGVLSIAGWFALGTHDFATAEARLAAIPEQDRNTESTVLLARALMGQRKDDQALGLMQDWLLRNPQDLAMLLQLAGTYLALGREEEALAAYVRIVDAFPNHVVALNNAAWLSRERDLQQAIDYAGRAHQLAPENVSVLDTLGTLLVRSGDVSRGFGYLSDAAARSPDNPEIQLHLAGALIQRGQFPEAEELLNDLLSKDPDTPVATEAKALLASLRQP